MKKISKKILANEVIEGRKKQGLTQQQLANKTGINRALLSRIETEDFMPSIPQLEILGEVLDFDITKLLTESNKPNQFKPVSPLKIAVAGTGYVGLSIATLLAQHNSVKAVDIIQEKVDLINQRKSPIQDDYIEKYLEEKDLDLVATTDGASAYKDADMVIIATPTNYDSQKKRKLLLNKKKKR